ncbi:MAG: hypothetical protein AB1921_03905, partial [Thermodesulfobacteriota bacterium]
MLLPHLYWKITASFSGSFQAVEGDGPRPATLCLSARGGLFSRRMEAFGTINMEGLATERPCSGSLALSRKGAALHLEFADDDFEQRSLTGSVPLGRNAALTASVSAPEGASPGVLSARASGPGLFWALRPCL